MPTTNFYLKPKDKKGLARIILVYQEKGRKFKYSTGIKIKPEQWDGSKIKGKTIEVFQYNERLTKFKQHISDVQKEALLKDANYNIETVESKLKLKLNAKKENSEFLSLFEQFMKNSRTTKTATTIKQYGATKTRLHDFAKQTGFDLKLENINQQFYDRFLAFCMDEYKMLNNSIGKHIKILKVFIHYLIRNELTNVKFNLSGFKVFKEDIDIIALTEEELFKIYNTEYFDKRLEEVKDYFCFECFTGLRFSDVGRLTNENVKGNFLEFRTLKTKDALIVPLNVFAKEIIKKYEGRYGNRPIPPALHNSQTNEYLKEIAEIAGLNEMIKVEKFSGSNRIEIRKQKCDFISTHTGRRTFITLSHEKGMHVEMIMKITGIKNWSTLKKYLKISEKAKLIKMNEFWNKENLNNLAM